MHKQRAERGGKDRAEVTAHAANVTAVPMYGEGGWRTVAPLGAAYGSDASLRWEVASNRPELHEAGALGMIRGRLFGFEPMLSNVLMRIAQRRAAQQAETRLTR